MSTLSRTEIDEVLDRVETWPEDARRDLLEMILESLAHERPFDAETERQRRSESDAELVSFVEKTRAHLYARVLAYKDDEPGERISRIWSIRDPETGRRSYADLLEMPADRREHLIKEHAKLLGQQHAIRRAMADFLAGQQFFEFYNEHNSEPSGAESEPRRVLRGRVGLLKTDGPPPTDEECRQILEEELMRKHLR